MVIKEFWPGKLEFDANTPTIQRWRISNSNLQWNDMCVIHRICNYFALFELNNFFFVFLSFSRYSFKYQANDEEKKMYAARLWRRTTERKIEEKKKYNSLKSPGEIMLLTSPRLAFHRLKRINTNENYRKKTSQALWK